METMHFKTVDPLSQNLLRSASRSGLDLNWERYEKQQPQDGFLRLGLSCPYGCMQGPCRIDPYGRGAERGICGLDRDGMAAAFLLRLALHGTLETIHAYQIENYSAEIAWPVPLDKRAASAVAQAGGAPLSAHEVLESAVMLSRPSATPEALVRQAVRLGLLSIGLAEQSAKKGKVLRSMGYRTGYGLLAGEMVTIGVAGVVPETQVQTLVKEIGGLKNTEVRLLSLGDWIPTGDGFLPVVCTSGEAETVLSAGKFNLLLAGREADPGLLALCAKMKVPVLFNTDNLGATDILKRARASFDHRLPSTFSPDPVLISEGCVSIGSSEVGTLLKKGSRGKIALIGGADTMLQSFGHLSVELAKTLIGEDHSVVSWGDAALWMTKQSLPIGTVETQEGPLSAVRALAVAGTLADLKGICFTGLKGCREFTLALGLAALGLKVSVAVPLPLWGSKMVREALGKKLADMGGSLDHFDHPVQGEELLEWFLRS
jgi:hypothetical protein